MRSARTPHPRSGAPATAFALLALCLLAAAAPAAEIVKSPADQRAYAGVELDNGLRVLLVSDPTTDKAAASLDVHVGSGSEPEGREGLAHFLEHMLFLGTEKYPQPGEYKDFINSHGGGENAYTAFDHTNYYFDIDKDFLEPALDRFAQFFVAPRFNPEYVARERQVVHSEYTSGLKSDGRRIYDAGKAALNPEHPLARFSVGSLDTLADRDGSSIRDELIAFYRSHYSAGIMTLVVLGKEPVDVLEKWVRDRFSAVPNTGAEPLDVRVPLFRPGSLPLRLEIVPVKDRRSLTFAFPIPPIDALYRTKPTFLLSSLLGDEGPGSLLAALKGRGWAEGLSAGAGSRTDNEALLQVSVDLTAEGEHHVDEIGDLLFRYVAMIREHGLEEWRYREMAQVSELRFRYEEKSDPIGHVRSLADDLHHYPIAEVLRAPYLLERFDPEETRRFLDLMRPDNVLVTLVAPGVSADRRTERYDVAYSLAPLAPELVARWSRPAAVADLALPEPNRFIPENLAMVPPDDAAPKPRRLVDSAGFTLWHQQDTTFGLPLTDFYFSVRSPVANDTPRHAMLTRLYVGIVNDQLDEFAYPASVAGLSYSLYKHVRGVSVRMSGYSDKESVLLDRILATMLDPDVREERFQIVKAELERRLRNKRHDTPYRRGISEVRHLLLEPDWTEEQRLDALAALGVEDLRAFVPQLLGRVHVVALAHGNLDRGAARALGERLRAKLVASAEPVEVESARVVRLEPGARYLRTVTTDHRDSATIVYLQAREKSIAERARVALLMQVISPAFFEALRTEQQLGYIVFATPLTMMEAPGVAFVVQSPTNGADVLADRIEEFIKSDYAIVAGLDDVALARHKEAVVANILEEENRLRERTDRYWNEIDREYYDFDLRERLADAVRGITRDELAGLYRDVLLDDGRRRLTVLATGSGSGGGAVAHLAGGTAIANAQSFKEGKELFAD